MPTNLLVVCTGRTVARLPNLVEFDMRSFNEFVHPSEILFEGLDYVPLLKRRIFMEFLYEMVCDEP